MIAAIVSQFFITQPTDKYIHIKSFRYGKEPSVIRCNRGDRLHLTFSTEDTGHSFFLEEFDIDVKVSPARSEVEVFSTSDPSRKALITKEYVLTARHPGIYNFIFSKSNYRCHVWCGPMHAFELGKLVVLPNTLLWFSFGIILGIVFFWIVSFFKRTPLLFYDYEEKELTPLLSRKGIFNKLLVSRWPQAILTIMAMLMIYIVILTSVFGTQMSGRNLGVLLMWAVWLFILVAVLTPIFGRI
ncbi:MAG: hypothetical protein HC830_02125, partial [Bacteroidetes bacterium]|nr:hypothetical protein [Bacteroidota bacterium]